MREENIRGSIISFKTCIKISPGKLINRTISEFKLNPRNENPAINPTKTDKIVIDKSKCVRHNLRQTLKHCF